MGKVIYLTGSPASGKSSLCELLEVSVANLQAYSYSKLLRDYLNRRIDKPIDESGIRQHSAQVVTRDDVDAVDRWLIEEVQARRSERHLVIDSHPVTKERYGFRVTPFTVDQLKALNPDVIVCLYIDPAETKNRIAKDAAGRPLPSDFEIGMHAELQATLAMQYAMLLGIPCYLLDSSVARAELVTNLCDVAGIA